MGGTIMQGGASIQMTSHLSIFEVWDSEYLSFSVLEATTTILPYTPRKNAALGALQTL